MVAAGFGILYAPQNRAGCRWYVLQVATAAPHRHHTKEFEKLELTGHNILWDIDYRRCGECGREITPISEQGRIDLQLDMYDGHCIVVKLGEEVKA